MKLWKSWVIANKDFSIFRKKKRILYTLIILPLFLSIGLPLVIRSLTGLDNPTGRDHIVAECILLFLYYLSLHPVNYSCLVQYFRREN